MSVVDGKRTIFPKRASPHPLDVLRKVAVGEARTIVDSLQIFISKLCFNLGKLPKTIPQFLATY